jgi:ATP-dependent Clp protease ATP-binding subunit ClpA
VLSRNLEKSLHRALAHANERRHEYATLEHLLLALTEDQDAVAVLRACSVDLDRLRREVVNYVDDELSNLVAAVLHRIERGAASGRRSAVDPFVWILETGRRRSQDVFSTTFC